jgi:hypothetical protein
VVVTCLSPPLQPYIFWHSTLNGKALAKNIGLGNKHAAYYDTELIVIQNALWFDVDKPFYDNITIIFKVWGNVCR